MEMSHIWYSFEWATYALRYSSFEKHDRTFENWLDWFQNYLRSRFYMKTHKCSFDESIFAEGVVFYNFKRMKEGKTYMAKLRRDMYPWYYEDKIEIYEKEL